jgi:multidrug efflux pump subunit AcrB
LFESFRDPIIILVSVPMSIAGAMAAMHIVGGLHVFYPNMMQFGGATLNIYTLVGIVTLMGLISKHGILMSTWPTAAARRPLTSARPSSWRPASACGRS